MVDEILKMYYMLLPGGFWLRSLVTARRFIWRTVSARWACCHGDRGRDTSLKGAVKGSARRVPGRTSPRDLVPSSSLALRRVHGSTPVTQCGGFPREAADTLRPTGGVRRADDTVRRSGRVRRARGPDLVRVRHHAVYEAGLSSLSAASGELAQAAGARRRSGTSSRRRQRPSLPGVRKIVSPHSCCVYSVRGRRGRCRPGQPPSEGGVGGVVEQRGRTVVVLGGLGDARRQDPGPGRRPPLGTSAPHLPGPVTPPQVVRSLRESCRARKPVALVQVREGHDEGGVLGNAGRLAARLLSRPCCCSPCPNRGGWAAHPGTLRR